jgi:hypothetical protein
MGPFYFDGIVSLWCIARPLVFFLGGIFCFVGHLVFDKHWYLCRVSLPTGASKF